MKEESVRTLYQRPPGSIASGLLLLSMVVVACSPPGGGTTGEPTESQSADDPVEVALVIHFRSPFTQEMIAGAEAAAAEFGDRAQLQVVGPQQIDQQAQLQDFQSAIASGAQGIAVVVQSPEIWTRPINDAVDGGIPVIQFNAAAPDTGADTFVGINGYDDYYALGEAFATELGSDAAGEIVIGNCFPGTPVLELRSQGFMDAVSETSPDIEFLGPFDVKHEPGQSYSAWEALANANPDALAMVGVCNSDPPSLYRVKENNPSYSWLAGGSDLEPDAIEGLKDGQLFATVSQNPWMQGYVPIRILLEHLVNDEEFVHGYVSSGFSVITNENLDAYVEAQSSATAAKALFQPVIDDIFPAVFDDPESVVRPFDSLYELPGG